MTKKELRKKYLELREEFDDYTVESMSLAIANRSLELPIWEATYFHLFLSIVEKKEVDTSFILHILQGRDKSIVIPKVDFKKNEMVNILLQENTRINLSSYGIPEPEDGIEIPPHKLDVVFVPLLAFDQSGNRIGYGKGFYDRFLAQCKEHCIFVGLSFFEPETKIDSQSTDIPLHYCITPSKLYKF